MLETLACFVVMMRGALQILTKGCFTEIRWLLASPGSTRLTDVGCIGVLERYLARKGALLHV